VGEPGEGERAVPASKIQNEQEIIRWFEEGKTYAWMVDEYHRKYDIETVASMFGNFRRRRGLQRRLTRDCDLIPWAIEEQHRWQYPVIMLRAEARRREGKELREVDRIRLDAWLRRLEDENVVVHYEPETDEGFWYVARREGIDTDIVRLPDQTTSRQSVD
jgi:hypothetical protein